MHLTARSAILLAAVISGLMLAPTPDFGPAQGAVFDLTHAPLCALLAWTAFHGLRRWLPNSEVAAWVLVVAAVFMAGVAIEFAQALVGRRGSLQDMAANGLGATAAMIWAFRGTQGPGARQTAYALLTVGLFSAAALRPATRLANVARDHFSGVDSVSSTFELENAGADGS